MGFVANFIRFSAVQTFWKSVKIWQSYREFKGGNFLRHSVYCTFQSELIWVGQHWLCDCVENDANSRLRRWQFVAVLASHGSWLSSQPIMLTVLSSCSTRYTGRLLCPVLTHCSTLPILCIARFLRVTRCGSGGSCERCLIVGWLWVHDDTSTY